MRFGEVSIDEYHQSDFVRSTKEVLDSGNFPKGCIACEKLEAVHRMSLRQQTNMSTGPEYRLVDIVLGNECNSDCVMCYPGQSSKIASRLKSDEFPIALKDEDQYWTDAQPISSWAKNPQFWNDLENVDATKIKFLGGEPFLNKGMWNWLKTPRQIGLEIITNGSILTDDMIRILEKWESVKIIISADAIGDQYNWIRHGLQWETVEKNISIMASKFDVTIAGTLSVYSLASLPEWIGWIIGNQYPFTLVPVNFPSLLSTDMAPINVIEEALAYLDPNVFHDIHSKIEISATIRHLKQSITNNRYNETTLRTMTDYFNTRRGVLDWKTLKVSHGNDS